MDQAICESASTYYNGISCNGQKHVDEIALPFIQIAAFLIVIIVLAMVGVIIRIYGKKVRQIASASAIGTAASAAKQQKILGQK